MIEVWQRIMKITVAAMSVRRRQCAADATLTMQHAAARDIMRMKITASRSDELVRLVRQKDQVPTQSADKLRDRATQPAAEVIADGPAVSSAAAVITHARNVTDSRRRDMRSVGAAGRRNKKRRHPIRRFLLCLLLIVALCVGGIFVYLVKSLNTIENHPLSDVTLCGNRMQISRITPILPCSAWIPVPTT